MDESFDCSSRPNHSYGTNRLYVEETMKTLYPNTSIVRLPGVFGPGLKKNVIYDLLYDNCLDAIQPGSSFQYYDISHLWKGLEMVQKHQIPLINLSTEPISTDTILRTYFPEKEVGSKAAPLASYDVRSVHAETLGGHDGYLLDAKHVLAQLGDFIKLVREGSGL